MRRKSYINLAKLIKIPSAAQVAVESPQERNSPSSGIKVIESKSLNRAIKQLHRMSDDELKALISIEDDHVLDCLIDQTPVIKYLQRERDDLKTQVSNLCDFNYAREPDYVRDRMRMREIVDDAAALRRRIIRAQHPLLDHLSKTHFQMAAEARKHEEESERLAQEFLAGNISHDEFIEKYTSIRKEASKKRELANRLSNEKKLLADNVPKINVTNSPIPTPRQRKRVSMQSYQSSAQAARRPNVYQQVDAP